MVLILDDADNSLGTESATPTVCPKLRVGDVTSTINTVLITGGLIAGVYGTYKGIQFIKTGFKAIETLIQNNATSDLSSAFASPTDESSGSDTDQSD